MIKNIIIWAVVIIVLALAAFWYTGSSPASQNSLSWVKNAIGIKTAPPEDRSWVVPNAIIPTSRGAGGTPIFDKAPAGTEFGGKNPPVTNKPVITPAQPTVQSSTQSGTSGTTTPYKAPVTDKPVI